MSFDYQKFVDLLNSSIMSAEEDRAKHLLIIETLMCSVSKVCKMTLDSTDIEMGPRTKSKMADIMVELISAMLRDYLDMENENV